MNKALLLLVGILLGGVVGWFTKPADATFQVGPLNIEIQNTQTIDGQGDGLTSDQLRHIGLIVALGGLVGLGLGALIDRQRI